jgi:hypothetical protein
VRRQQRAQRRRTARKQNGRSEGVLFDDEVNELFLMLRQRKDPKDIRKTQNMRNHNENDNSGIPIERKPANWRAENRNCEIPIEMTKGKSITARKANSMSIGSFIFRLEIAIEPGRLLFLDQMIRQPLDQYLQKINLDHSHFLHDRECDISIQ